MNFQNFKCLGFAPVLHIRNAFMRTNLCHDLLRLCLVRIIQQEHLNLVVILLHYLRKKIDIHRYHEKHSQNQQHR